MTLFSSISTRRRTVLRCCPIKSQLHRLIRKIGRFGKALLRRRSTRVPKRDNPAMMVPRCLMGWLDPAPDFFPSILPSFFRVVAFFAAPMDAAIPAGCGGGGVPYSCVYGVVRASEVRWVCVCVCVGVLRAAASTFCPTDFSRVRCWAAAPPLPLRRTTFRSSHSRSRRTRIPMCGRIKNYHYISTVDH